MKKIRLIIKDYGVIWLVNRMLYFLKIKFLNFFPWFSFAFDKQVRIERTNLFNINYKKIENFLLRNRKTVQGTILAIANNAIQGKIYAFESKFMDFGEPINWFYNPITKKELPSDKKWFQISDFDKEKGDIKVVWEPSRLTHFYYFIRAHMLTKDIKYYQSFSNQLDNWLKKNIYGYGPNYKCGQEATLRMINAMIAYDYFFEQGLTTEIDQKNIQSIIKYSYKKVKSNFNYAYKCIKNNHTFTEILGLIIGAWASGNNRSLIKGYRLLDKEIIKQFSIDGGYTQYSFNYQRFTLQIFEHVLNIPKEKGIKLKNLDFIKKSIELLYFAQNDSGELPNYGSNDGALIFPVTVSDYRDFRPTLNALYAKITGYKLYDSGKYDEELFWNNLDTSIPIINLERNTKFYDEIGHYIYRLKEGFVFLNLQDYKSRPAHFDQLHFDFWYKSINVFCDTGTYSYADEKGQKLSLTSGHNVPIIDEKEQMNKEGEFLVLNWSKSKVNILELDEFDAELFSFNGFQLKRNMKFYDTEFLIRDTVTSKLINSVRYHFHTPLAPKIKDKVVYLYNNENLICTIECDTNLEIEILEAYSSKYYLQTEMISLIRFIQKTNNNIEVKFKIKLK